MDMLFNFHKSDLVRLTSSATPELDDGPHSASTLSWNLTKYITFITTNFMYTNVGTKYICKLMREGIHHKGGGGEGQKSYKGRQTWPLNMTWPPDRHHIKGVPVYRCCNPIADF